MPTEQPTDNDVGNYLLDLRAWGQGCAVKLDLLYKWSLP